MTYLRTIHSKLLLAAVLVAALTLAVQAMSYHDWYRHRRAVLVRNHATLATTSARVFETHVEEIARDIERAALATRAFAPHSSRDLSDIARTHPEVSSATILDDSGSAIAATPVGTRLSIPVDMLSRLTGLDQIIGDLERGPDGKVAYLIVARALSGDTGIVALDPAGLSRLLSQPPPGARLLLLDSRGTLAYDSFDPRVGQRLENWPAELPAVKGALQGHTEITGALTLPDSHERWLGAAVPVGGTGWVAMMLSPTSTALAPVLHEMRSSMAITILVLVLIGMLVVFLGRQFTAPVAALAAAAGRIGRGDLSARVHVRTGDELEQTADAFNRMADSLESTIADLKSLQSILDVGLSPLALDHMLEEMLERLLSALRAEHGTISLLDPIRGELSLAAAKGVDLQEFPEALPGSKPGEGIIGRIAEADKTVYFRDVQAEPATATELIRRLGTRSVLGTTLKFQDELIGVVLAGSTTIREFEPREVALLEILADRAATVIQNRRLYDRQVEQRKRAVFLAEASDLFNSTLRLEEILDLVVRKCCEVLGDHNMVMLLDKDTQMLHAGAAHHDDPELLQRIRSVISGLPLRVGVGVSGAAVEQRRPVLVSRFDDEVPENYKAIARHLNAKSALAVPLVVQDEVIGALLSAVIDRDQILGQDDVGLASEIAGHAAAAIANGRLYDEIRRRAAELETLWEVGQTITTSIEAETVLETVAREVGRLVDADAVNLFLYDDNRRELTVRARCGLDAEPEAVRYRPGEGLVGRVADSGKPLAVRDVINEPGAKYPDLARARGLQSALFVPLIARRETIGMIAVYSREMRDFDESDIRLVSTLASFAAAPIENAKLYERERAIAETLQESFRPSEVEIGGLDLAMAYYPGSAEAEIGGDFYDVLELPDGRVGFVIADVSGKGLDAAVYTVRIKYAIQSFAALDPEPARVLANVNRVVAANVPTGRFVTVFFGVLDPRTGRLVYTNAGHEQPVIYDAEGQYLSTLEVTGPAIGGFSSVEYEQREIMLRPSDLVVLYTDGVTDARRNGRFFDLEGLMGAVLPNVQESSRTIVDELYRETLDFGKQRLQDDVTLMVLRLEGQ